MIRFIIFLGLIVLSSCTKPIGVIEPTVYLDLTNSRGVYVGCEGNFMYGNASLSYYDKDSGESHNQIFFNTNNFPIGDVLQSTKIVGDDLYLMVNNSGKIYIVDKNSLEYKSKISGLVSPRYIEFIGENKAYITDMYSPSIAVLNRGDMSIGNGIQIGFSPSGLPRGTEEMVRYKDFVFTTSWSFGDKVYKIDVNQDKVVDSLTVTLQPNSLVMDTNNKLWVLSDGSYVGSPMGKVRGALTRIDADSFKVDMVLEFESDNVSPSRLRIDGDKNMLYYVYGSYISSEGGVSSQEPEYGVYQMSVSQKSLPKVPFISAKNKLIYSLGVDPYDGDIYIGDAIDYIQRGVVYRYSNVGVLKDEFNVGIIPGSFTFKED